MHGLDRLEQVAPARAGARTHRLGVPRLLRRAGLPGLLFVAPALLLNVALFLIPLVRVGWISLHEWPVLGARPFLGLRNYTALVNNDEFWQAL